MESNKSQMRIFFTGASGFIGQHLLPLLNEHELLIVGRRPQSMRGNNTHYIQQDLSKISEWQDKVRSFAPEACIHLAWTGIPDYSLSTCLHNLDHSVRLLELLGELGCDRIFLAGTCWEYGELMGRVKESNVSPTMGLFASFKTAVRKIGESLAKQHGVKLIWGRIFFVYGFGQRRQSLIPSCYDAFQRGDAPVIHKADVVNDFIHVLDVARAILALIESNNACGIFNIGSGVPTSVGDVVKIVAACSGKHLESQAETNSGDKNGFWANISSLKNTTNWEPKISVQYGIRTTISQYGKST